MISVTAANLKSHLFEYLARVSEGETISVQRDGEEVAVIVPGHKENWRNKLKIKAKLLVPPDSAFAPLEDIWENYS
ncbi:MAG: type II toxin-antitoxin system Phd/YefM family antitoxin [Candidatus Omnitrophota bacterium]